MPYIAHDEYAGHAGFHQFRIPIESPTGGPFSVRTRSCPERMKPRSSRSTTPSNHSVLGSAPIKMNSELAGTRVTSLLVEQRIEISSSRSAPCTSTTLELNSRWMLGVFLI